MDGGYYDAASAIALRKYDGRYCKTILRRAKQVFNFANNQLGNYNDSIGDGACPFYCDFNGRASLGAVWLYRASNDETYWSFIESNIQFLGFLSEFGWDSMHGGINVLISEFIHRDYRIVTLASDLQVFGLLYAGLQCRFWSVVVCLMDDFVHIWFGMLWMSYAGLQHVGATSFEGFWDRFMQVIFA
ncbi:hypothetical protein RYX36_012516 [Vicia faba]